MAPSHVETVDVIYAVLTVAGALGAAAVGLFGHPLRESLPADLRDRSRSAVQGLRRLHSGHIGDYIAWWSAGAAAMGLACLLAIG